MWHALAGLTKTAVASRRSAQGHADVQVTPVDALYEQEWAELAIWSLVRLKGAIVITLLKLNRMAGTVTREGARL